MKDSLALVIFGITSNLAQIKLIPALYDMAEKDLLPADMKIFGNARTSMSDEEFCNYLTKVLNTENIHHTHPIKKDVLNKLLKKFHYLAGHLDDQSFYLELKRALSSFSNKIFYLATYPDLYHHIFENLQKISLNQEDKGFTRLMIEKPIGTDLESSKALNMLLLNYFHENQIFRLDHYLGKETLQNILTFRFANDIFEPLINSKFIDHIQITASEDFGIGKRGGYYDQVGALKDVGQNHQLQMLAFATMDSPKKFTSEAVSKERIKILKRLVSLPKKVVFGQYKGYTEEKNVSPDSTTDTFYALKTYINNGRFKDIPIYIRAGKKLPKTATEISIIFKNSVNLLFKGQNDQPNVLIYRIAPNEGIVFKILTKKPGSKHELESEYMQYCYKISPHNHYIPDPYERLIFDSISGDQTFFNSAQEVEAQWSFIDPLAKSRKKPIIYRPGSWGPKEANKLIEEDGKMWLEPSMEFCRI